MSSSEINYSNQKLDSVKLSQEDVDGLPELSSNQMGISHNFAFKDTVANNDDMPDGLYMVTIQVLFDETNDKYLVSKIYRMIIIEK